MPNLTRSDIEDSEMPKALLCLIWFCMGFWCAEQLFHYYGVLK